MNLKKLYTLGLMLTAVGGFISLYLWNSHLSGSEIICNTSCESVVNSEYGVMLGIPLGAYGFAFYALLALLLVLKLNVKDLFISKVYDLVLLWGVVFTIYLRYVEFFKLGELCIWCWGSVAVIGALCILVYFERKLSTQSE